MNKLKAFWASVPQSVKTGLVIFEGGASGALFQLFADPGAKVCFTKACLQHYIGAVLVGGWLAVRYYYTRSPKQVLPPAAEPIQKQP